MKVKYQNRFMKYRFLKQSITSENSLARNYFIRKLSIKTKIVDSTLEVILILHYLDSKRDDEKWLWIEFYCSAFKSAKVQFHWFRWRLLL